MTTKQRKELYRDLWVIIRTIILLIIAFLLLTHSVGVYNGLNKGIYILNCGLEVVGNPGFFCGNY